MSKIYKKYGVTTDGYRGKRSILEERVIEGLEEADFSDKLLQLTPDSTQTIYLNSNNMSVGSYIVLPNAKDLWPNWQVAIINESAITCPIYYYTSDYTQLSLFKEVTGGNMTTCILLDDTTEEGTWTTLRTVEQSSVDLLNKYTSDVLEETEITWNELKQDTTSIQFVLGSVLTGTAVKSVYIKTTEQFTGMTTLNVSVGIADDTDKFSTVYDLTNAVADNNFTKDEFDEILSTTNDTTLYATFTGTGLNNLTAGSVKIVVEKAKLIDPTVLKNPIVQTQIPIGVIMNYAFTDLPEGYWRLDGSLLPNAAAAIPQFVKKLNTINNQMTGQKLIVGIDEWNQTFAAYGACGKFAWQGTSLKFPAINCFIQGLSDLTQLSLLTEAGLPNITGSFMSFDRSNHWYDSNGQFYVSSRWNSAVKGGGGDDWGTIVSSDASRSNSTYGRSNTVTPLNIKYPYIISVYNKIQNASMINLDEIIEASVNKANISLDNLNAGGRQMITNACMPDYASVITGTMPSYGSWVQVLKNSFVEVNGTDPYMVDARAYVSPDNGTTTYQVGYFYSDFNGNTRGTSFTFFIPAGWYFKCTYENGSAYYIYPLKGVQ